MNEDELVKTSITEQELEAYVGKQITVWQGRSIRNSFDTHISICGILEKHPENKQCRVLVNTGTYTYFQPENVVEYGHYKNHEKFKDGSVMVVRISTDEYK